MSFISDVVDIWKPIIRKWAFEYKQYKAGCMKRRCFGIKNSDKTFYLISLNGANNGLFTGVAIALTDIEYAIRNKWIPVVEAKGKSNPLWAKNSDYKNCSENTWEYYFEQPVKEYTLSDVYKSRRVFTSWQSNRTTAPFFLRPNIRDFHYLMEENNLQYWSDLYKRYIRYMPEVNHILESDEGFFAGINGKILGVMLRLEFAWGAEAKNALYNMHPQVPTLQEMIQMTEKYMKDWGCDYIFLSGDCREVIDGFKEKFGDKCITINRKLLHLTENGKWLETTDDIKIHQEFNMDDENWRREKNVDYLREINALARCHYFLGSQGSGASFAIIMNGGKYVDYEIYDEGVYTLNK